MRIPRFDRSSFALITLLALCVAMAACSGTRDGEPKDSTAGDAGESMSGGDSRAQELLREASEMEELRSEKQDALVGNLLDSARTYRDSGELEKAWDAVIRAREIAPNDAEAIALYNQIGRQLGYTEETIQDLKSVVADRYRVAQQAQRVEAERRLAAGVEAMDLQDFDAAIRDFETVLSIAHNNPYADVSYDDLSERAEELLREARAGKRTAAEEREEALARKVYDDLQAEEDRLRSKRAERVRSLLEDGFERFDEGDYDASMKLAEAVLDIEPGHAAAIDLLESSREARHGKIDREILRRKQENFVTWLQDIREAKIPQAEILRWGDPEYWADITRRRRGAEIGIPLDEESPEAIAIRNRLDTQRVNLDFEDAPLDAVIDYLQSITNINMVIDPEVRTELEASGTTVRMKLTDVTVGVALATLLADEEDLTYTISDDIVLITRGSKAVGTPIPKFHDVKDIAFGLTWFRGPEIKLTTGEEEADEPIPEYGSSEVREPEIPAEDLLELVRTNIAPETWDQNPGTIDITSGNLLVVHTPDVQRRVAQFLNNLRKFRGLSVTIEARFLTVRDNFLQDVGVDFRGLGGEKGTLADLDDVTNGLEDNSSAGFDNFGPGLPAGAGGNPSSGAFFDDGGDGDYRGRTENLFDQALGNMLTGTGGLSLQLAYLDDVELNAVLRAVEKTDKATLMTAPVLTAYDTQRSSIHMINQISFIEDYEVEVAQTAFIADPVVGIIQDGVVFDVRPTVSNDRKYIQLELNPTVASLRRPIPTFTTNLGGLTFPVTLELPELTVSKAGTTVVVPDGGTVVIGGLKQIRSVDRKSETPLLADIPVLGFLFSRKGKSEEIEDLILIVTATINDMIEAEQRLGMGR